MDDRANRVIMTFGAGLAARAVQAAALLAQVPLAIGHLGVGQYGMWMAIVSISSFVFLADLGLSSSLTSLIAEALGRDDRRQAGIHFTSALVAVACFTTVVAAVCCVASGLVPWSAVLSLDARDTAKAAAVFRVLAIGGALTLITGLFARSRIACQEGYRNSLWEASGALAALLGLAIAKRAGADIVATIAWTIGFGLLPPSLNALLLIREKPWLIQLDRAAMARTAPRLIRLSAGFFILTMAYVVSFQTHGAVISHYAGPRAAAEYAVGFRLFGLLPQFFSLMLTPLWPAYRDACVRGDTRWTKKTLAWSLAFTASASAIASLVLLGLSDKLIAVWLHETVLPSPALRLWFAIWAVTNCIAGCLAMFYHGLGWMRFQVYQAVPAMLAAVIIWPLVGARFGAAGILGAYVVAHAAFVVVPGFVRLRQFVRPAARTDA